jgi:hypothetical protein
MTLGLVAALAFGTIVLVKGDWVPGTIIVVAALVGLAGQVPVIRTLRRRDRAASPPGGGA